MEIIHTKYDRIQAHAMVMAGTYNYAVAFIWMHEQLAADGLSVTRQCLQETRAALGFADKERTRLFEFSDEELEEMAREGLRRPAPKDDPAAPGNAH